MKKDETPYSLLKRPESVFHLQYAHQILAHGKLCPWCKDFTMQYHTMVLVYRIPVPRQMDQIYPARTYFHKDNWDWVCSQECAQAMRERWASALLARSNLAKKIAATQPAKIVPQRKGESYRDRILRLCRIDPEVSSLEVTNPATDPWRLLTLST